jgi:hypothetical protein
VAAAFVVIAVVEVLLELVAAMAEITLAAELAVMQEKAVMGEEAVQRALAVVAVVVGFFKLVFAVLSIPDMAEGEV